MFKSLRKTSLYILAIPIVLTLVGAASNQAVLYANNDRFPVMWNTYKVAQYRLGLEKTADTSEDLDIVIQATFDLQALESEGFIDDTHCVMTSQTHLNLLADIFDMKNAIYSIGDFLLMLGEWLGAFSPFLFVFDVIRKLRAV